MSKIYWQEFGNPGDMLSCGKKLTWVENRKSHFVTHANHPAKGHPEEVPTKHSSLIYCVDIVMKYCESHV